MVKEIVVLPWSSFWFDVTMRRIREREREKENERERERERERETERQRDKGSSRHMA